MKAGIFWRLLLRALAMLTFIYAVETCALENWIDFTFDARSDALPAAGLQLRRRNWCTGDSTCFHEGPGLVRRAVDAGLGDLEGGSVW